MPNLLLIKTQYVDVYGKCRIIKWQINNSIMYSQTLLPPLPKPNKKLKDINILIKLTQIDTIKDFINIEASSITDIKQCLDDEGKCVEISITYNSYDLIFNVRGERMSEYDLYETRRIIYTGTNVYETFSKMKRLAHKLKEEVITTNSSINSIVDKFNLDDEEKFKIVRKLEYFKNIFKDRKINYQSYIENIYDISDYKKFSNQRIIYISRHIIPQNNKLQIQEISKDLVDVFIEPYIVFFNNNIFIAQDTNNIENSFYISQNWNVKQFNYKKNDKFSGSSDSFTIYEYDGKIKLQKGDGTHQIILINPKKNEHKFITLLPI